MCSWSIVFVFTFSIVLHISLFTVRNWASWHKWFLLVICMHEVPGLNFCGHRLVQRFVWISSVPPDKFRDSTCDLPLLYVTSLPVFYWPFIWSLVAYSLSCWRCCQTPWSKRYQVHPKWCLSTKIDGFTSQKTVTFNIHCQNFKPLYTFLFS